MTDEGGIPAGYVAMLNERRIAALEAELAEERRKLAAERRWRERVVGVSATTTPGKCVVGAVAEVYEQLALDDKHRMLAKMLHDTAEAIEAPVK